MMGRAILCHACTTETSCRITMAMLVYFLRAYIMQWPADKVDGCAVFSGHNWGSIYSNCAAVISGGRGTMMDRAARTNQGACCISNILFRQGTRRGGPQEHTHPLKETNSCQQIWASDSGDGVKLSIAKGTPAPPLPGVEQESSPPGWIQMWRHGAPSSGPPVSSSMEQWWSIIPLWALSFLFLSNQCPETVIPNPFSIHHDFPV